MVRRRHTTDRGRRTIPTADRISARSSRRAGYCVSMRWCSICSSGTARRCPALDMVGTLTDAGYRVIIYSMRSDAATILDCLDNGAVTYLTKSEGRQHLVPSIEAAVTDHPYVSPSMAGAMSADTRASRPKLTEREREVLIQWFRTESKTFAAKALYITASTLATHLGRGAHQVRCGRSSGVDESGARGPCFAGRNHQHRRPVTKRTQTTIIRQGSGGLHPERAYRDCSATGGLIRLDRICCAGCM